MSEPLSRKKFITKLDAYPTSDDSFVYRQLLAHDAALRQQLATAQARIEEAALRELLATAQARSEELERGNIT